MWNKVHCFLVSIFILIHANAFAGVEFFATIDRNPIPLDESVSLQFLIEINSSRLNAENIKFHAPGFDTLNSYDQTFMKSFYDNGRFGVKNTRKITKILRPRKKGLLKISRISVTVNGKNYKAKDIVVRVTAGGGGGAPPKGYGGQLGLRQRQRGGKQAYFLRTEVNKKKLFKGEQVMVSYYMFERLRVFNPEVKKYPDLKGFLREELEMPIVRGNRTRETVVLSGIPYHKTLLLRYAAYPLRTGKLKIDSLKIKGDYYPNRNGLFSPGNDPFSGFFNQLKPRTTLKSSEAFKIEVIDLPEVGRPSDFSGAVGKFSLNSGIDRYQVRANEPVNLLVKIDGRGNLVPIKELQIAWPSAIELYESKGRSQTDRGGRSQKVFEYLLIPREPGKFTIPGFEFSYFDPDKKLYQREKTSPIILEVGAPKPGTKLLSQNEKLNQSELNSNIKKKKADIRYLKLGGMNQALGGDGGVLQIGRFAGPIAFILFLVWVISDLIRTKRNRLQRMKKSVSDRLHELKISIRTIKDSGAANPKQVDQKLDEMIGITLAALAERYGVRAKTHARRELQKALSQSEHWDAGHWPILEKLIEDIERVRFSGASKLDFDELDQLWRHCQEVLDKII